MNVTEKFTEKQKLFAEEYLFDLNASRAYMAVYKCKTMKTAGNNGYRLLKKPHIKAYIDEKLQQMHNDKTANAQEVIEYLTSVMRGEALSEVVVNEGTGDGCSEARLIQKKPDGKEKLKAAELLGKRFSVFSEKVKVEGAAVPVIISGGELLED